MLKSEKKRSMILIILVFVLPVLLAAVVLKLGLFNPASTNRGELLQPTRLVEANLPQALQGKWLLLYQTPVACEQQCKNSLYTIQQVHLALGRNMQRVEPLVFSSADSLPKDYKVNVMSAQDELTFNLDKQTALYIADPLGNVMMRYWVTDDTEQAVMTARDMLRDLNKMLKLSKVG